MDIFTYELLTKRKAIKTQKKRERGQYSAILIEKGLFYMTEKMNFVLRS